MRKIVLFIAFIMSGLFVQAQSAQLEEMQVRELNALEKIVTYEYENLTFNKNQIVKLERLFFKKSTEVIALKNNSNFDKGEYAGEYKKIQDKYKPLVEAILSPAQKIEYRRNMDKKVLRI